jgi:hypothetical protein
MNKREDILIYEIEKEYIKKNGQIDDNFIECLEFYFQIRSIKW